MHGPGLASISPLVSPLSGGHRSWPHGDLFVLVTDRTLVHAVLERVNLYADFVEVESVSQEVSRLFQRNSSVFVIFCNGGSQIRKLNSNNSFSDVVARNQ